MLGVTASGPDLAARSNAYAAIQKIHFDGCITVTTLPKRA